MPHLTDQMVHSELKPVKGAEGTTVTIEGEESPGGRPFDRAARRHAINEDGVDGEGCTATQVTITC